MDYSDEYDSMAEEWEDNNYLKGPMAGGGGGGGGAKKKKKPTTVGKKREGGVQAWGTDKTQCPAGCKMKCCASLTKR
jgi:hypothetical protein